jgi:transposase InsO family protein
MWDEYNKVSGLDNAKQIWDTLKISHEGNDVTMITKMELVEGELGRFAIKRGEEPTETYNSLKTLANKIWSYGSTRWTDHDIVQLMLRSFTVIDPHLVNLIHENPRYTKMTPEEILRNFVSGRMMVKEARYVDDIANGPLSLYELQLVAYLSIGGSKYGLVIVDDFARFTWVFFLQDNSKTQGTLKRFLRRAQNEFELKVKKIRSDNGSEFKNLQVEKYLEEEGIKHEFFAPYTPQQNGVVERKNRTLINMARTMSGEYKIPERFWSEAVNTACHAINRLYLHCLLKKTSYELLTGNKPNVSYFCVFGSKCYVLVKKGIHSKFALKVVEGFLLGYDSNTKAYRVFNKSSGLVEVSSDIVFDETNGSSREQVDLDDVDEDEVPTTAMRTMAIGDVRPQEHQDQDQPSSSTLVHPPTQDVEQVPQDESMDQGGST